MWCTLSLHQWQNTQQWQQQVYKNKYLGNQRPVNLKYATGIKTVSLRDLSKPWSLEHEGTIRWQHLYDSRKQHAQTTRKVITTTPFSKPIQPRQYSCMTSNPSVSVTLWWSRHWWGLCSLEEPWISAEAIGIYIATDTSKSVKTVTENWWINSKYCLALFVQGELKNKQKTPKKPESFVLSMCMCAQIVTKSLYFCTFLI